MDAGWTLALTVWFSLRGGAFVAARLATDAGGLFGIANAIPGDLDGDGTPDFVIGAPRGRGEQNGLAVVYSGRTGERLRVLRSDEQEHEVGMYGYAVEGVGDLDADGLPDVAVGAPRLPRRSEAPSGRGMVYVHSGADGSVLLRIHSPAEIVEVDGWPQAGPHARFGESMRRYGDHDGDGVPDLLVGGGAGPGPVAWLMSGADGGVHTVLEGDGDAGYSRGCSVDVTDDHDGDGLPESLLVVDSGPGGGEGGSLVLQPSKHSRTLHRFEEPGDEPRMSGFGSSGGVLGDLDGDGAAEFFVIASAPLASEPPSMTIITLGDEGFGVQQTLEMNSAENWTPLSALGIGDVTGDGCADYVVAHHGLVAGEAANGIRFGTLGAWSGRTHDLLWLHTDGEAETRYRWALSAGDFDGDGALDVLLSKPDTLGYGGEAKILSGTTGRVLLQILEEPELR